MSTIGILLLIIVILMLALLSVGLYCMFRLGNIARDIEKMRCNE